MNSPPPRTHTQIRIRPTKFGYLLILALAGMAVGSANYNNNPAFAFTFLLAATAFVSALHGYRNLRGIAVLSARAEPVFAGDPVQVQFLVRPGNRTHRSIVFSFPYLASNRRDLAPGRNHLTEVFAGIGKRGVKKPGPLLVYSEYPLGLLRFRFEYRTGVECLVYPKPMPNTKFRFKPYGTGEGELETVSGVDDFEGLKTYQPGDSIKRVAWKASTRGQGLFTKVFMAQAGASIMLSWDMIPRGDKETRLSILCSLVLEAHHRKVEYGLELPGSRIEPALGEGHKHRCLRQLALFP